MLVGLQQKSILPAEVMVHHCFEPPVSCGRPTMMFAVVVSETPRLLVGMNEPSWAGFPAIANVTRQARDFRLQHYVPIARLAFNTLRDKEATHLSRLQASQTGKEDRTLQCEARREAILDMRNDPTFLGGTEIGLALRLPGWHGNQPCYVCQGMMGYQSARRWSEKDKKGYLGRFDWEKRGDYPHSCAEAEVRCKHMELDASEEGLSKV